MMRVLALLASVPALMAWNGFVLMKLWGWFAVPAGFRPLTVAWAYGIVCLVGLFKRHPGKEAIARPVSEDIGYAVVCPLFGLAFGYLAHVAMVSWGW